VMKIRSPKATALIYASGKMVCLGTKTEEDSKLAAKKVAKAIQSLGFKARFCDFKIQNNVATVDCGF
jgi:transcription initiation factor TFIID TATA-box-binding protein